MWICNWLRPKKQSKSEIALDPIMKYLIVGLGNIGEKYADTRHNVGFQVVDHMANEAQSPWKVDHLASLTVIKHKGRQLILIKPSTYMNLSGKAVRYWMQKEKISKENLLIVVDDIHLDFGNVRLRGKGSDAGHNGIKDINQMIGSDYARIKIGIGSKFGKGQQVDYVLGDWSSSEKKALPEMIDHCAMAVKAFATIGLAQTMSAFNRK